MTDDKEPSRHQRWAALRFAVVGPLLAAPPTERGALAAALAALARQVWRHPITGEAAGFARSTIERWYYQARAANDPVTTLRRKARGDRGTQPSMGVALRQAVITQYREHKSWSYKLHRDNLVVRVADDPPLGPLPSYPTVRRFMVAHGLIKRRRRGPIGSPGAARAEARIEAREVRSYEAEYVNGLWHLDFHHGSRKIALPDGTLRTPLLLGVLDDRSRLCCHAQWYLDETAQNLVHALSQGFQKRSLPRSLLTDNGSPMIATETEEGLTRLGVLHRTTLDHSPYQNGKQEVFWAQVEGRLVAMLEGVGDITLALLNDATAAWVEMEYNRAVHSETGATPLARYLDDKDVGRPCPPSDDLRLAFTAALPRTQRRSDGTISIEGRRFEVPSPYRHIKRVHIRYARWDLGHVYLWDAQGDRKLCQLFPLDRVKNADGRRRALSPVAYPAEPVPPATGMAPLLRKLMTDYAATGLPPAFIPKDEIQPDDKEKVS
jgi:transposase InsO family protein